MIWMAVTADKYELPLCVETSQAKLARRLGVTPGTVGALAWRYRNVPPKTKKGRKPKYRIATVEEI